MHLDPAGSSVLARSEEEHEYADCGKDELRFVMAAAELQRPRVRTVIRRSVPSDADKAVRG